MDQAHKDCRAKLARFNSQVKVCDPEKTHVNTIHKKYDDWTQKLETLLADLVVAVDNFTFEHNLTPQVKKEWEDIVEASHDKLSSTINALEVKLASSRDTLPVQTSSSSSSNHDNKKQVAIADVSVDHDMIISEGDLLKEEFQKFDDWGEAEDEDVEAAMKAIESWRKKFNKLSDVRWTIQKKTQSHSLDDAKSKSANSYVNLLGAELNTAIELVNTNLGR